MSKKTAYGSSSPSLHKNHTSSPMAYTKGSLIDGVIIHGQSSMQFDRNNL